METWCLIRLHGDREVFWWEDRGDGEYWWNRSGGKCPKSPDDEIIECSRVESLFDLNWKKTGLYCKDTDYGWLSPSGEFFGCNSRWLHDALAVLCIGKEPQELEKKGWLKLDGFNPNHPKLEYSRADGKRLTIHQRNYLLGRGFLLNEDD